MRLGAGFHALARNALDGASAQVGLASGRYAPLIQPDLRRPDETLVVCAGNPHRPHRLPHIEDRIDLFLRKSLALFQPA